MKKIVNRRQYKEDIIKAAMIYFVYKDSGEQAANKYADENFGKSERGNWALKNKLELYNEGGWEKDWLTNMYRDLQKVINKYNKK